MLWNFYMRLAPAAQWTFRIQWVCSLDHRNQITDRLSTDWLTGFLTILPLRCWTSASCRGQSWRWRRSQSERWPLWRGSWSGWTWGRRRPDARNRSEFRTKTESIWIATLPNIDLIGVPHCQMRQYLHTYFNVVAMLPNDNIKIIDLVAVLLNEIIKTIDWWPCCQMSVYLHIAYLLGCQIILNLILIGCPCCQMRFNLPNDNQLGWQMKLHLILTVLPFCQMIQ